MKLKSIVKALCASMLVASAMPAMSQISGNVVKLGLINDQSGPLSSLGGPGAAVAAQMAIEDMKSQLGNIKVELIVADHQNKADLGATIVKRWFDVDAVDAVLDVGNSAVGLAIQSLVRDNNKIAMYAAVATTELTGKQCTKTGFAWLHDTRNLVSGPIKTMAKNGLDSWYFIGADYAFGKNMVQEGKSILAGVGGKTLGEAFHPMSTSDYSSYLLQAQSSGAKVIGFANAGAQVVNSIKQWKEFGMQNGKQKPVVFLLAVTDVHGVGLDSAKGMIASTAWYWDKDEQSRAFAKRFFLRQKAMPTEAQASMYSATAHYLKAVIATKTDATDPVAAQMRATPVNDMYQKNARIRADGKLIHDFLFIQVKAPEESKYPWDYYKINAVIPPSETYLPLSQTECPLVTAEEKASSKL